MRDMAIRSENRLGALAEMGEALANPGVSVEGRGAFVLAVEKRRSGGPCVLSDRAASE